MPHIHVIHVGSTTNKGTYALLKSEILQLKKLYKNAEISVSTSDIDTLTRLEPTLNVYPPLVDIPYERADLEVTRRNRDRETKLYKFYLFAYTFFMFVQAFVSIISSVFIKLNLKPIYRSETLKKLDQADLIISTADENFKEGTLFLPFNLYWKLASWTMLFSRMWDIIIAKRIFRKNIIVFPNSVGPFRTRLGRFMARMALNNVDSILLREPFSGHFVKELKVKTPTTITCDIALLLELNQMNSSEVLSKPAIGVSPGLYALTLSEDKQEEYVLAHCKTLDYMIEKYDANIVFLPHEVSGRKGDDLSLCKIIIQKMEHKEKARILKAKTLEEFESNIAQLDLLISSRMHPMVLACSVKVPTVLIFYDHKQTSFFKQLNLGCYTVNINEVTSEKLLSTTEYAWKQKDDIKKKLELIVPALQNDVRTKIKEACLKFLPLT